MKKILFFLSVILMIVLVSSCSSGNNIQNPSESLPEAITDKTSVLAYGAKNDGSADCSEAFATSKTSQLCVPEGKYAIQKDTVISASIRFDDGAVVYVEDGVTVTVNGYLDAGLYKIFGGDGAVILGGNSVSYPEWFGAVVNSGKDCSDAIQKAIDCFPNGFGKVMFRAGKYTVKTSVCVKDGQDHLTLEGIARQTREIDTMIVVTNPSKPALSIVGTSGGGTYDGSLEDVTIRNMEFSRDKMGPEFTDSVYIENTIYTTFNNVGFSRSQNGLRCVNANGVRIECCHGTTGGDIKGKEVRGIYIDGSKRGSTGILITDYIYYGYGSSNSISYAYKDYNAPGANGTTTGDRRITNFECAGPVDYGMAFISESCGWAGDVSISAVSMDGTRTAGLYFRANGTRDFQHANINNVYLRLDNEKATAIYCQSYSNVSVTNLMVDNAIEGKKNTGVVFKGSKGSILSNVVLSGMDYKNLVNFENCENCVVNGCTSNFSGIMLFKNNKNTVVTANSMSKALLDTTGSTNCVFSNNIFYN